MFCYLYWGGGLKIPSIRSNRDDSSTLLSSRHPGSRFARQLEKTHNVLLSILGRWVENFVDSIESRRFVNLVVESPYRKSICASVKKTLNVLLSILGRWVDNSVDSIESRRLVDLVVESSSRKSTCATLIKNA